MVNLDIITHLQQLVQARGRLTGIHVAEYLGSLGDQNGFKGWVALFSSKRFDQTGQSEIPL